VGYVRQYRSDRSRLNPGLSALWLRCEEKHDQTVADQFAKILEITTTAFLRARGTFRHAWKFSDAFDGRR
jgi:hypothetical protein